MYAEIDSRGMVTISDVTPDQAALMASIMRCRRREIVREMNFPDNAEVRDVFENLYKDVSRISMCLDSIDSELFKASKNNSSCRIIR